MWVSLIIVYEEGFAWLEQLTKGKGLWRRHPLPLEEQNSLSLRRAALIAGFCDSCFLTLAFSIYFIQDLNVLIQGEDFFGQPGLLHFSTTICSFATTQSFCTFSCLQQSRELQQCNRPNRKKQRSLSKADVLNSRHKDITYC